MSHYFIDRPVFAWVIAIFIALAGLLSLTLLPIAQYPTVAPPSVNINATYPGASAELLEQTVTSIIELELNGAEGLLYFESESSAAGTVQIIATFAPGTDPDMAAVDVQNRLKRVEARLPAPVRQQGVTVTKASSSFLVVGSLVSEDGTLDAIQLGDFITRNIIPEVLRIPGVGESRVFGTEHAMRVWVDPNELMARGLTMSDVANAINAQNIQISAGSIGGLPAADAQQVNTGLVAVGQLDNAEDFGKIVLYSREDGALVRLSDVAKLEMGGLSYTSFNKLNGKPSAAYAVMLTPTGNALETATLYKKRIAELEPYFPPGVKHNVTVDNSTFIEISIESVQHTLFEAVLLVFLVMLLFLQKIRATLIPTMVVPVALLGAFAVMYVAGFSINVLTMFGLVLAIGIVVDDAIVVVENVERIIEEEHLSPREATHKAMSQIQGAIIGITLVLCAVFVPMGFFGGVVGKIYQQFALAMVSSILFSAILALTWTPALCASLLRPQSHTKSNAFFEWFNRTFERFTDSYQASVARVLRHTGKALAFFVLMVGLLGILWNRLPTSFLPLEDQGAINTLVNLPVGASAERTSQIMDEVDAFWMKHPAIDQVLSVRGFSFTGSAQNAAIEFIKLKPWDERDASLSSFQTVADGMVGLSHLRDAMAFTINPPPIRELGRSAGFSFRLQDRSSIGHAALVAARDNLVTLANQQPELVAVRLDGLEDTPQMAVDIDRDKAAVLGLNFADIANTLSIALGSSYINDFPNLGRQQRVIVQADAPYRMQPEDIGKLYVRNKQGGMVPLSEIVTTHWTIAPVQLNRYNGYPAMKITGEAAPGYSTGDAMAAVERVANTLGSGIGYEWTSTSLEERTSGSQVPMLLTLSLLAVFLCLAALYESWSIPTSVLLVVPLGVFGAVLATTMRGLPNDVYFKVGIIAIIGLSSKNAILIVEFAKDLQAEGMELIKATIEASVLRFRPILMTSLAFILGVVPLMLSRGAGSASQHAIGTAVFGGMVAATVLAVFLVPVFYVVIRRLFPAKPLTTPPEDADHA